MWHLVTLDTARDIFIRISPIPLFLVSNIRLRFVETSRCPPLCLSVFTYDCSLFGCLLVSGPLWLSVSLCLCVSHWLSSWQTCPLSVFLLLWLSGALSLSERWVGLNPGEEPFFGETLVDVIIPVGSLIIPQRRGARHVSRREKKRRERQPWQPYVSKKIVMIVRKKQHWAVDIMPLFLHVLPVKTAIKYLPLTASNPSRAPCKNTWN